MNTWLRKWLRECDSWEYRTYGRTGYEILRGPGILEQSRQGADLDAIQGGYARESERLAFARNPHALPFGYSFEQEFTDLCISVQVSLARAGRAILRNARHAKQCREIQKKQRETLKNE